MKKIYLTLVSLILVSLMASAQTRIYTPALRAPANNAVGQTPDVTLDWDAVTGQGQTITYTLQLAQNADFSDAITFEPTIFTALKMNELKFGEYYLWRVKATDGASTSEWSAPFTFRVVNTVTITAPNNQSTQNPNPLVKWTALTGVTHYDLQIDTAYSWAAEISGINTQLNDVFEIDETHAWAVGDNGIILKRTTTGWTSVSSPTAKKLFDVFFLNNQYGCAVGESGTILFYDGTQWTSSTSGVTKNLNGVFFTSPTSGVAVGNDGTVLRFNGSDWTAETTGVTVDFYAIHGLDANHIWATGKAGNLAFYNGTSWTKSIIINRDMLGIWALAPNKVYTSAKAGRIYQFDGNTWTEIASGSTKDLNDICFIDETEGYAVGAQGTLVYYNGDVWAPIASGTTQNLNGVFFSSPSSGYFVGAGGVIVAFQGEGFNSPYLKNFSLNSDISEFQFNNLLFGRTHYFRIRARHATSTSDWSSARSFSIVARPTLLKPTNNASNISLDTLAQWEVLTGVVRYTVQLATEQSFSDPFTFETNGNSYRFQGLSYGQDYYWRVNTRHAASISDWSEVFKFTTINTVSLSAPTNNATGVSRMPLYEWKDIKGTEKYMMQVSKTNTFADVSEFIVPKNFYQSVSQLNVGETYFWRVRGIQGLDSTNWSNAWSFVVTTESGIADQPSQSFSIHPNPGNGQITLQLADNVSVSSIEVYTLVGKKVFEMPVLMEAGHPAKLDLSEIGKGIFLVRVNTSQGNLTRKLIIE